MSLCVITGATSGIGKETAILLSKKDWFSDYIILVRDLQKAYIVKDEMLKNNDRLKICIYKVDLSHPDELSLLMQKVLEKYCEVNCMLNIAGFTDPQPLFSESLENIEYTYKVNVFSPLILIRECGKRMKGNGGKIINVASTAGITPRPGWLTYASSKAAIISASSTLTEELAEYGIKVYCVSPGRCATALRKKLAPDEDPSTIMQPQEAAEAIVNLVCPDEQCLDGQNIIIRKRIF